MARLTLKTPPSARGGAGSVRANLVFALWSIHPPAQGQAPGPALYPAPKATDRIQGRRAFS